MMNKETQRLIVGMGATGLSMASYWQDECRLIAVDDRNVPPKKAEFEQLRPAVLCKCGENFRCWQREEFEPYEAIAVSPGIAPHELGVAVEKLTNDAACFSEAWQREAPAGSRLLAVTGTNGKSTVAALAAHIINSSGKPAQAIGNIGEPMLEALLVWRQRGFPAVAVVELSSFQLELAPAFYSDAALVLNVGEDHLDRHGDIHHYAAIKRRLYGNSRCVVVNVAANLYPELVPAVSYAASGGEADWTIDNGWACHRGKQRYRLAAMSDVCRDYPELVLAALALTEGLALPCASVCAALASFAGLPHRRQVIANYDDIIYVDDSKATNVAAALFALTQAAGKVVWIGGGDGKGQDFRPLAAAAEHLRAAVLFGKDALALQAVLADAGVCCEVVADMSAAVHCARRHALAHDMVLLSPACSSLDMFANYQARGRAFAHAVREHSHAG